MRECKDVQEPTDHGDREGSLGEQEQWMEAPPHRAPVGNRRVGDVGSLHMPGDRMERGMLNGQQEDPPAGSAGSVQPRELWNEPVTQEHTEQDTKNRQAMPSLSHPGSE